MERLHVHYLRELVHRLRAGASQRAIAHDLGLARTPSTVEPYREQVEQLVGDGVEMMPIFDRVHERGYSGSYSSIRRFVRTLKPANSRAVVRVHAPPGEETQVDFGSRQQPSGKRCATGSPITATCW